MRKLFLISSIVVAASGCVAPNGVYQNPVQNLRDLSINQVRTYSVDFTKYLAENNNNLAIEKATETVRQKLKDPDSAKFQKIRIVDFENGKVLCGEVNGKNSYGGYVGFKPFAAGINGATIYDTSSKYANVNEASNAGITLACGY